MSLKLFILQVLALSRPYLMPANALRTEIETRRRGRIGDTDFADAMQQLEARGLVDTPLEIEYLKNGGGLNYVLRNFRAEA